jgi:hypothetical protein
MGLKFAMLGSTLAFALGALVGLAPAQAQRFDRDAWNANDAAAPYPYADRYRGAYAAGPYGYADRDRAYAPGSTYVYGADRANPSVSPNGFDQDSARDFQLDGHN